MESKLWHIHTVEYSTAMKKKNTELLVYAAYMYNSPTHYSE